MLRRRISRCSVRMGTESLCLFQIYQQLNIFHLQDKHVDTLSGGERKRLGLATALVHKPDVMLLDEPTNHLDVEAIQWLENHLAQRDCSFILITHDRYFLEACCKDEIWELESGKLYRCTGKEGVVIHMQLLELGVI